MLEQTSLYHLEHGTHLLGPLDKKRKVSISPHATRRHYSSRAGTRVVSYCLQDSRMQWPVHLSCSDRCRPQRQRAHPRARSDFASLYALADWRCCTVAACCSISIGQCSSSINIITACSNNVGMPTSRVHCRDNPAPRSSSITAWCTGAWGPWTTR